MNPMGPFSLKDMVTNGSLSLRTTNLTTVLEHTPLEELKMYYPLIVEHIFGWPGYAGWNLAGTKRDFNPFETNCIVKFLRASGPLLDLSYKLMMDESLTYNFPIAFLPLPLQRKLKLNEVPAYLAKKIQQKFDFDPPQFIALNAFEFYFFTFAHCLLNGMEDSHYLVGWGAVSDSIYIDLFQDYLSYFFPCTGGTVPPIQYPIHSVKAHSFNMPQINTSTPNGSGDASTSRPSLFKTSVFQNESATERELSFAASTVPECRTHVWRSEVILNVIITMWFNVESPPQESYQFQTILPSVELVKCVRVFTRHFHFFINSISLSVDHPLEEIRRTGYPIFQKKLYVFLRYLFKHWSSDYSFRIVYETWLTYIQPWRYTKYDHTSMGRQAESEQIALEGKHHDFVMENLLFYTTLFQLIIPRLRSADYNSLKNAHMAYRIAKVYTTVIGLKELINDVEESLLSDHQKTNARLHRNSDSASSWSLGSDDPSSFNQLPTRHHVESATSGIKLANAKKRIRELEGHQFVYKPLFSEGTKEKVAEILKILMDTYSMYCKILPVKETPKPIRKSWVHKLLGPPTPETVQPFEKVDQRMKMQTFLGQASEWLAKFFDLPKPPEMEYDTVDYKLLDDDSFLDSGFGRSSVLPKGVFLPRLLEPVGNPDLASAKSFEFPSMVKLMLKVSRFMNHWVPPMFQRIYFEDKKSSKLVRAVLAPPAIYVDYEKFGPSNSTRIERYLPPRINLRLFANVNAPYVVMGIFALAWYLGIDGLAWFYIPALVYFFYIIICAMLEPEETAYNLQLKFFKYITPQS